MTWRLAGDDGERRQSNTREGVTQSWRLDIIHDLSGARHRILIAYKTVLRNVSPSDNSITIYRLFFILKAR
jgi:hypothetical protein